MLRTLGVLLLGGLLLLGGAHAALKDRLLFQSDAWSLTVYFAAAGFALLPVLAAMAAATCAARRRAPRTFRALHVVVVVTVATAVLTVFFILLMRLPTASLRRFLSPKLAFGAAAVLVAAMARFQLATLVDRVERLSVAGLAAVAIGAPAMVAWNHWERRAGPAADEAPKRLVVVVMDRFPAHLLHPYNDAIAPSPWDDLLSEGRVYREMRTVAPYTHRYFGSLYTGRHAPPLADGATPVPKANLWATLQQRGVHAQWVVGHRNATPEGSEAAMTDYRGLRSFALSQRRTWIPRLLGLDYHVFLDPSAPHENYFTECLLPRLQETPPGGRNAFTLFHINWDWGRRNHMQRGLAGWGPLYDMARAGHYAPSEEPVVAEMRRRDIREVVSVADCLTQFFAALRQDPSLRNTTVVLTADHGFMYGDGRLAYGLHPNHGAVKVLCAAIGPEQPRTVDERFFSTPDLAAGILDHFGVDVAEGGGAQSVFGAGPGRDYVTSITTKNDDANQWWLVVVDKQREYCFNLHRFGNGRAVAYRTNTFERVEIPLAGEGYRVEGPPGIDIPAIRRLLANGGAAPALVDAVGSALGQAWPTVGVGHEIAPRFCEAAARFGIRPREVHPAYVHTLVWAADRKPQGASP